MDMDFNLEALTKFRENYIWIAAELMVERTVSAAVMFYCVYRKETFDEVRKLLESVLNDRQKLSGLISDDLYLVENATESDLDLLLNDYLPTILKSQIESLDELSDLQQPTPDEISTEFVAVRKRKIGFIS